MKTKFMKHGSTMQIIKLDENALTDNLRPGVYSMAHSQMRGHYLNILKDRLEVPSRIYGGTKARVSKCIKTYKARTASTGILLTGDKGTGKTLLMSILANKAITELKLPVILIQDPFNGSEFTDFVKDIGECVMVFDEFGKMYASDTRHSNNDEVPQKSLLSLMDGVDKTKRLIILTENSELDISEFMLNRPSRIYYHFRYNKLDEDSIIGYCKDYNVKKDIIKDIIDLSRRSRIFSFDMLQSLVEEHLRFNCDIKTVITDLNIDTREDRGAMIEIVKVVERSTEKVRELFESPFVSKPDTSGTWIKVKHDEVTVGPNITKQPIPLISSEADKQLAQILDNDEDNQYEEVYIRDRDLAYEQEGKLVYETENFIFVAKHIITQRSNYFNLF